MCVNGSNKSRNGGGKATYICQVLRNVIFAFIFFVYNIFRALYAV